MTEQEFISFMGPLAQADMAKSGVLASVTMAQAILESGYGSTELARNANNFFGMKCSLSENTWPGSTWDGVSKYRKQTGEEDANGNAYTITADFRKYASAADSVADHSAYLLGAMNGRKQRYAGLKGEKDPAKAIGIIKAGGYATDTKYVNKVLSIINKYNLTKYDQDSKEQEGKMEIKLIDAIMTKSPCYTGGRLIDVKGMYLHSIGCPCEKAQNIINNENQANAGAAVQAVVQANGEVWQGLPVYPETKKAMRNWHCGSGSKGSGNNTHIGVEMTEPATIKYTGGSSWVEVGDGSNTKAVVLANYKNAVAYFALRCKQFGLDPLKDGVIISHKEGHDRGYASNHGDPEHIWGKFGLTMNQFRRDVKTAMVGGTISVTGQPTVTETGSQKVNALSGTVTVSYTGSDGVNIRTAPSFGDNVARAVKKGAAYTVTGISADEKWYQIVDDGKKHYITAIPDYVSFKATQEQKESTAGTGYYRVRKTWADTASQIGAFKQKENAINLCKANGGYRVFDQNGKQIYPAAATTAKVPYSVRVETDDLRIRKGAGTTYDYWKEKNGQAKYTGKGVFTIVEEKEGAGATKWGLLKSYEKNTDGWISLDYAKRV